MHSKKQTHKSRRKSQTQQEAEQNTEAYMISHTIIYNAEKVVTFRSEPAKDCPHRSETLR